MRETGKRKRIQYHRLGSRAMRQSLVSSIGVGTDSREERRKSIGSAHPQDCAQEGTERKNKGLSYEKLGNYQSDEKERMDYRQGCRFLQRQLLYRVRVFEVPDREWEINDKPKNYPLKKGRIFPHP